MIARAGGLNLRASLEASLGRGRRRAVEETAARQERTIDAILARLYHQDEASRRELFLLADEVGLGKTFVALGVAWSVLLGRAPEGLAKGPVLVVTPGGEALWKKWQREAEAFKKVVAPGSGVEVLSAATPHELARALDSRRPRLVIARMAALTGRLHQADLARLAALHALFHQEEFALPMAGRLALLEGWPALATRENLDLRASSAIWERAREAEAVGCDASQVLGAWRRLEAMGSGLCQRLRESWARVRAGKKPRASFEDDLRELCRAALGQLPRHDLPLVIVDEIHNWKNHPQSYHRCKHMLGRRLERLLGLSATPFQLGPHELIQILRLGGAIKLPRERRDFLAQRVEELAARLKEAQHAGEELRAAWAEVGSADLRAIVAAWRLRRAGGRERETLPPRLARALDRLAAVHKVHGELQESLRPFLLRHRRDTAHRAWRVGREALPGAAPSAAGASTTLAWGFGLDPAGDAELVHYLMMRVVQEVKGGRGTTTLGADLGGSYEYFAQAGLARLPQELGEEGRRYLALVKRTLEGNGHRHPKVAATVERAFHNWQAGEKTLVFCFNLTTADVVQDAIRRRIEAWREKRLAQAFCCPVSRVANRLRNFQNRLYDHRQGLFLLFQDYPLAGSAGRLPRGLALGAAGLRRLARELAAGGPPQGQGRFDRRLVIALAERVLVERWQESAAGRDWLGLLGKTWLPSEELVAAVTASDWRAARRHRVEGRSREPEAEPLPDDGVTAGGDPASREALAAWRGVLAGRAGRAALAPYLGERDPTSLLAGCHARSLAGLPAKLRPLAVRMLRRLLRSPEFLARFILDPGLAGGAVDETADEDWLERIRRGYQMAPAGGEAARDRFEAYLASLGKAVGLDAQIASYEEAGRNREVVARVTGQTPDKDRDRFFVGFNSPLFPEVLVVTAVGQEGIDLHRECRQVIHHDLPWNPATLEQRTGRVDRIGSKTDRIRANGNGNGGGQARLEIAVPYIAGTYDERRFRVLEGRARLFEVTMGGDYAVDGYHRPAHDAMEEARPEDEGEEGAERTEWCPLPAELARDLRLCLEADGPRETVGNARRAERKPRS